MGANACGAGDVSAGEPDSGLVTGHEPRRASGRWHLDLGADTVPVRWVVLILGAIFVASIARSPHIFRSGRFWAEEGTIHFSRMLQTGGFDALGYVQSRTGYLNLFANIATWLAEKVPLANAPLVSVWLTFALVLTVAWVALVWPSDLLPNAGARIAAAVLLAVGTGAVAEVWVNSINAQTTLAVLTLLLLFTRVDHLTRWRFATAIGLLALAGLSGLYSIVLAPLFLLVALRDRRPRRWALAGTITACGLVQGTIFVSTRASGQLADTKAVAPGFDSVFRGLAGYHLSGLLVPLSWLNLKISDSRKGHTSATVWIAVIATVVFLFLAIALWRSSSRPVAVLLGLAFVLTEGLVQLGAHNGDAGGRYAVVPVAILILMVIHAAVSSTPNLRRVAAVAGVVILAVGLQQFLTRDDTTLRCRNCPDWSSQVAALERGEIDRLEIWPYEKHAWFVNIGSSRTSAKVRVIPRRAEIVRSIDALAARS